MERTHRIRIDKAASRLHLTQLGFFRKNMPIAKGVDGARWRPDVGPTPNKKLAGAKEIPVRDISARPSRALPSSSVAPSTMRSHLFP